MSIGTPVRLILAIFLLLQSGCLSHKRVVPETERLLPAQTMSRDELVRQLQKHSQEIRTLTGAVTLDASGGAMKTGVLTEYRQTKGYVLVDRPQHIRIKAQAPLALATVFDMVSNGREFRVSIPLKNKFLVGDTQAQPRAENPMLNLRPQHILDALFIDVIAYLNKPQIRSILEETTAGRNSYYVFHFIDIASEEAQLIEKLWIDRSNMHIVRKQLFRNGGRIETDVQYADHQSFGGILFPQVISIQRPIEDYSLKITFQKTALNESLGVDAFNLQRPAGAEFVEVERELSKRERF